MKQLKSWLTPPVFDDELKTEQTYLLHIIVWTLIWVPIPFVIYSFLRNPEYIDRTVIQAGFGEFANFIVLFLLRRGFVKTASILQVTLFWLFFTITAITGSGVYGEAYLLGYGLVIAIAGILLGGSGALVFTTLSLASGAVMVFWELKGIFVPVWDPSPLTTWMVSLVLFPVGAVLQHLASRKLRTLLERTRSSEEQLRNIIEYAEEIIYTLTTEGNFIFVSPAWARMLGHSVDEVVGHNYTEFIHPEDIPFGAEVLRILEQTGQAQHGIEYRVRHKNGNWLWHTSVLAPVKNEKARSKYFVGIAQDITEQKQTEAALRESESTYRRAIEVAGAVPYRQSFDENGKIIYEFMGDGIREITGYGPDEFSDELWGELTQKRNLLEDLEPYSLEDAIERVRTGQTAIWKCEHLIKDRHGNLHWVFEAAVDLRNENGIAHGSIGMYQDITQQKFAAEATIRRRDTLEKIVRIGKYVTEMQDERITFQRIWRSVRMDLGFDRLGIYLYDPISHSVHGTYGTNNTGEMIDETDKLIDLKIDTLETEAFINALKRIDGYYITHQYEMEHDTTTNPIMHGVKDFVAVAAWAGDLPVAVLCVDNAITQRPITDEDVEALRLFAGYAGLAIKNSQLNITLQAELQQQKEAEAFEQRRRILLEKVIQLGQHVTETTDLKTILDRIWHGIHDELDFDRLGIFLYNREHNSMDSTLGTDTRGNKVENYGISFPLDEWQTFKKLLESPDGLIFTHNYDIENNVPTDNEMYGVKDLAAVAVWAGDKPVASISVDQLITQRRISIEQLEALRLFAGYAGLAIENSRLNEALKYELTIHKQAEENEANRRAMLEKVVTIGKQVTEVTNVKTTVERIWHAVHDELGLDRVGIYFYDKKELTINMVLGTDNQGNMDSTNRISVPMNEWRSLKRIIEKHGSYHYTPNYTLDYKLPEGHEMYGVKDHAMFTAWVENKPVAILVVDNNITQQPITEQQMEALRLFTGYVGLAIENARLNEALQTELTQRKEFIGELESKNAELERFTYTVSHDLKSPLVTITGFLGFLEKDALTGDTEKVRTGIKRINNAAHKMQSLLNDLLELSRIGRIINPPEDIPFEQIVNEAIDRVHGRLDEINAMMVVEAKMPIVRGDRVRLVEVVQNLLENATKYKNPHIQPHIEIGVHEMGNSRSTFFVRDNGVGIEPQYHERIFGLFNKLDATAEGTGIGLTLVKRIIEVHGGRIWVESESGEGATFYFTLPIKE